MPKIYFYIRPCDWVEDMPDDPDIMWPQMRLGRYGWVLLTYLNLRKLKFPCELVKTIPDEGVIITSRIALSDDFKPGAKQLIVVAKGDSPLHPYAQIHIIQNPEESIYKSKDLLWRSWFIRYWPQPGLVPRSFLRADRFENIVYVGIKKNLDPELKTAHWRQQLKTLGLTWNIMNPESFHDYSNVDAVIAVRSFSGNIWTNKPSSKLINAWHAGVPAVVGVESAYRFERRSELDYIEIKSVEDAVAALKLLRNDKELRKRMSENCKVRAKEVTREGVAREWINFINNMVKPAYEEWRSRSHFARGFFFFQRRPEDFLIGKVVVKLRKAFKIRTRIRWLKSWIKTLK